MTTKARRCPEMSWGVNVQAKQGALYTLMYGQSSKKALWLPSMPIRALVWGTPTDFVILPLRARKTVPRLQTPDKQSRESVCSTTLLHKSRDKWRQNFEPLSLAPHSTRLLHVLSKQRAKKQILWASHAQDLRSALCRFLLRWGIQCGSVLQGKKQPCLHGKTHRGLYGLLGTQREDFTGSPFSSNSHLSQR